MDPADDLHHHGDEEPDGAAERPVPALPRPLIHRRGDGSGVRRHGRDGGGRTRCVLSLRLLCRNSEIAARR